MAADLQSSTVIVTGGAGGLGKTIATAFLKAGSSVAICDINQERLAQTESDWTASNYDKGKFLASHTDITDETAVKDFVASTVSKLGRVDLLINNAGMMDSFDGVATTSKAQWDRVIGLNLSGVFLMTKEAVLAMESQSPAGGTVINIGSVAGYKGSNAGAAYTASKHAVVGLTKSTAAFYGKHSIYCIALLMGGMDDTNIGDAFSTGAFNQEGMALVGEVNPGYETGKTNIPLDDVAKYCVFLADRNMAAAMNGAGITMNKNWPAA